MSLQLGRKVNSTGPGTHCCWATCGAREDDLRLNGWSTAAGLPQGVLHPHVALLNDQRGYVLVGEVAVEGAHCCGWPAGSGCCAQTSGGALPQVGYGQWWQANESHLPSCHSKAPPAASELEGKRDMCLEGKGTPYREENRRDSNA